MPEVEARPKIAQHDESTGIGLSVESYAWPGCFRRAPTGSARGDMDDGPNRGGGLCLSCPHGVTARSLHGPHEDALGTCKSRLLSAGRDTRRNASGREGS